MVMLLVFDAYLLGLVVCDWLLTWVVYGYFGICELDVLLKLL